MDLGFGEIVVVLVVVLLLFGPSKLPKLGESLGKGIREFRKAVRDEEPTARAALPPAPRVAPAASAAPAEAASADASPRAGR